MESKFTKDSKLTDLIKVYKKCIPKSTCNELINKTATYNNWHHYGWLPYKHVKDELSALTTPADDLFATEFLPIVSKVVETYNNEVAQPFPFVVKEITNPEIHKFTIGTKMLPHHDHGYKGVPLLTVLGLLNDEFDGGEFIFWNDEIIKLEAGDILLFPSMFAYTHQISPITKGNRYSVISWIF